MACDIHEDDIGTTLTLTITDCGTTLDISTASSLSIFIRKPDGTLLTRTGVFTTDGTDGKIYYVTVAGDTDVAGTYKIQGKVTFPSTASYYTNSATFHVERNL